MSANQSVIKYEEGFKKEDLIRYKLKAINPQGRSDGFEKCASFDKGGIEVLLYVIEDFAMAVSSLNIITTAQHIEFFKKILGHGPSEKFKRLRLKNPDKYTDSVVQQLNEAGEVIGEVVNEVSGFNTLTNDFIRLYCTSTDSKGDLIEYLKSEECKKPMKASVATHQDRMEELMRFTTMLEGSRPNLTEDEQKLILFRSFPEAWQINWNRTQVTAQEATVEKLMRYMCSEKEYADKEWKKNHKKKENGENKGYQGRNGGGRGRGYQGRGGRGRGREGGRGGRQGRGNSERCRQHEGAHLWKDCPSNWKSTAGIAAGAGRGRGGGRDGGRGRGRGGYDTNGRGGYESYHANGYPPPPPPYYGSPVSGTSLPPVPHHVSVGPSESHYYSQRGGSYPPSVAPTHNPNEVYMCSDGRFYPTGR